VLVLDGAPPPAAVTGTDIDRALALHLSAGESKKEAIASVATALGVAKRTVYDAALRRDQTDSS
jgi:16S rRNA (cytidine1402-2'-O)-methyltransferase